MSIMMKKVDSQLKNGLQGEYFSFCGYLEESKATVEDLINANVVELIVKKEFDSFDEMHFKVDARDDKRFAVISDLDAIYIGDNREEKIVDIIKLFDFSL